MECRRRSGDNWGRNRCQLGGWCWRNCNGLRWSNGLGGNLRGDRLRRLNWLGGLNGDWSNCSRWLNWLGCRGGGDGSSSGLDCRLRHCWRHHRLHAGGRSLGHSGFASGLPHERLCLHILGAGQSGFCNGGLDNCCHSEDDNNVRHRSARSLFGFAGPKLHHNDGISGHRLVACSNIFTKSRRVCLCLWKVILATTVTFPLQKRLGTHACAAAHTAVAPLLPPPPQGARKKKWNQPWIADVQAGSHCPRC